MTLKMLLMLLLSAWSDCNALEKDSSMQAHQRQVEFQAAGILLLQVAQGLAFLSRRFHSSLTVLFLRRIVAIADHTDTICKASLGSPAAVADGGVGYGDFLY